jgi:hypothetical protein
MRRVIISFPELFSQLRQPFLRGGITNTYKFHYRADENPNAYCIQCFKHEFSISIWIGLLGDHLIGPQQLPYWVTSIPDFDYTVETADGRFTSYKVSSCLMEPQPITAGWFLIT